MLIESASNIRGRFVDMILKETMNKCLVKLPSLGRISNGIVKEEMVKFISSLIHAPSNFSLFPLVEPKRLYFLVKTK